jgi:hypothetical protein
LRASPFQPCTPKFKVVIGRTVRLSGGKNSEKNLKKFKAGAAMRLAAAPSPGRSPRRLRWRPESNACGRIGCPPPQMRPRGPYLRPVCSSSINDTDGVNDCLRSLLSQDVIVRDKGRPRWRAQSASTPLSNSSMSVVPPLVSPATRRLPCSSWLQPPPKIRTRRLLVIGSGIDWEINRHVRCRLTTAVRASRLPL